MVCRVRQEPVPHGSPELLQMFLCCSTRLCCDHTALGCIHTCETRVSFMTHRKQPAGQATMAMPMPRRPGSDCVLSERKVTSCTTACIQLRTSMHKGAQQTIDRDLCEVLAGAAVLLSHILSAILFSTLHVVRLKVALQMHRRTEGSEAVHFGTVQPCSVKWASAQVSAACLQYTLSIE